MAKIADVYEIKEELGKGAFSVVKLAINKKNRRKMCSKDN